MLQSISDSMRPHESISKALRRLKLEKELAKTLKKQSQTFGIDLFSKTREAILEHASYLMSSPAVKCVCWWPTAEAKKEK